MYFPRHMQTLLASRTKALQRAIREVDNTCKKAGLVRLARSVRVVIVPLGEIQ